MPHPSLPPGLLRLADYERQARALIDQPIWEYIAGGAGDEITLTRNRAAFDAIALHSRMLRDFRGASTASDVLGERLRHPILLGPVAYQKLVHGDGELATLAGANAMDAGFVASTLSSVTLEAIAAASTGSRWFQLYWQISRDFTLALVRRAEDAGFSALVVTVDVPVTALRYRAQHAGFVVPDNVQAANLVEMPSVARRSLSPGQSPIFDDLMADAPNWHQIAWLQEQTPLPILLKGITHPEDARKAKDLGLAGAIVSNHGGRALDGVPATITLLPGIRAAVGDDFTLLLDSGIRTGSDVFKALALGANAVLVGRPQLHALALGGALGVAHMLRLLVQELEVTMALAGCPTISAITPDAIFTLG